MAPQDPRLARTRSKILATVIPLLTERGFAGLSIEAVAAASGVAKSTIYRHWPTRAALAIAAFETVEQNHPVPDTGSVRNDLVTIMRQLAQGLSGSRWAEVLPGLIDAAERDAELRDFHRDLTARRRIPMKAVLQRGLARGELPAALDLDATIDLLSGPLFYRRFISHLPVREELVEHVVDAVLAGVRTAPIDLVGSACATPADEGIPAVTAGSSVG